MGSSDATSNGNGSSGFNGVCSSNTTNGHGSSNGSSGPCNENSSCIDSGGCIDSHRGASSNEVSLSPPPSSPSLLNSLPLCLTVLYTSIYLILSGMPAIPNFRCLLHMSRYVVSRHIVSCTSLSFRSACLLDLTKI